MDYDKLQRITNYVVSLISLADVDAVKDIKHNMVVSKASILSKISKVNNSIDELINSNTSIVCDAMLNLIGESIEFIGEDGINNNTLTDILESVKHFENIITEKNSDFVSSTISGILQTVKYDQSISSKLSNDKLSYNDTFVESIKLSLNEYKTLSNQLLSIYESICEIILSTDISADLYDTMFHFSKSSIYSFLDNDNDYIESTIKDTILNIGGN